MRKIATIALLAAASVFQTALGKEPAQAGVAESETISPFVPRNATPAVSIRLASIGAPSVPCPEGTFRTRQGLCQPPFDFD